MNVLDVLIPVGVGAFIGYGTNAIAIKMLFRPYKPVYIGKWKLPFTPGIIPKQRDRLAQSMGNMVSNHLFAKESLVAHLESEGFQTGLRTGISALAARVYSDTAQRSEDERELGGLVSQAVTELIPELLRSPKVFSMLHSAVPQLVASLGAQRLSELGVDARHLAHWYTRLHRLARRPDYAASATALAGKLAGVLRRDERSLDQRVPVDMEALVHQVVAAAYQPLTGLLLSWLSTPEMRASLTRHGKGVLERALERLSGFQRFLVSAARYDQRLGDEMPAIIDDLISTLKKFFAEAATRDMIEKEIRGKLGEALSLSVVALEQKYEFDIEAVITRALLWIPAHLPGPDRVASALERVLPDPDTTVASLVEGVAGKSVEELGRMLLHALLKVIENPATVSALLERLVPPLVSTELEGHAAPARSSALFEEIVFRQSRLILLILVPQLVKALDVKNLVVARVEQLSTRELEGLIVGIVGREFTWINIIGGILGGLIGLVQVFLK